MRHNVSLFLQKFNLRTNGHVVWVFDAIYDFVYNGLFSVSDKCINHGTSAIRVEVIGCSVNITLFCRCRSYQYLVHLPNQLPAPHNGAK